MLSAMLGVRGPVENKVILILKELKVSPGRKTRGWTFLQTMIMMSASEVNKYSVVETIGSTPPPTNWRRIREGKLFGRSDS